ncbi:APC family permease [Spiroplasma endosymbiont of Atherix ibis]|uniref:APC family permease n=1 Tax=Spiroplasma endosymbiont of Atherix ibis TaxID=3066291 RepID=UPI0030D41529
MIKVNKTNKRKNKTFEFLTIFSMVFGIVVGGGIYLKNSGKNGVLAQAGNNPYLALSVWVFIGVLCSLIMLSFIEAASSKTKLGHSTAQSWANTFINRKTASMCSILYICMYLPILAGLGALFTINTLFNGIDIFYYSTTGIYLVEKLGRVEFMIIKIFLSTLLLVGFSLMNIYTHKPSKMIQSIFTIVKFIPLFSVVVGGFTLFILNPSVNNSFNPKNSTINSFGISPFFATILPILFAFDGFIYAATLQKDCEHKEVVPVAMLSAIIAVTLFYIIITVAVFLGAEDGNIFNFFDNLFIKSPWAALIFKIIIACTLLTTVNGYTTLIPKTVQSAVEEGFIYTKSRSEKISYIKSGYIGMIITLSIYTLFLIISICIGFISNPNGKQEINYFLVADYSSNSTVMFAFIIYLILMIAVLHNRKTNKVEVNKVKGGFVIGIITTTILIIVMGYIYYDFFINKFKDKEKMIDPILLIFFALIIALVWVINECLLSKSNIDENDLYLRIQPRNWFRYNKEIEIEKYKRKLM